MGRWNDDRTAAFCVWKLFLVQVGPPRPDARQLRPSGGRAPHALQHRTIGSQRRLVLAAAQHGQCCSSGRPCQRRCQPAARVLRPPQIKDVFDDVRHPWNRKYPKACSIYRNPVLLSAVRSQVRPSQAPPPQAAPGWAGAVGHGARLWCIASSSRRRPSTQHGCLTPSPHLLLTAPRHLQHRALFSTHLGRARCGVLCSPADFFAAFNNGYRAGQRRYFTYSLLPDSLRCSETGAAFFSDFMSKHAMHAGGAEEVVFAVRGGAV